MRHPRPLPGQVPAAFTTREGGAAGLDANRMRRADLRAPFHAVRARAGAEPVDVVAALLRAREPGFVAFGPTAAHLWGIDLPWSDRVDDDAVHLAARRPKRAPRGRGIVGASLTLAPEDLTTSRAIPVTTPARTWVDLARFLPLDALVASGDAICAIERDLCSDAELAVALDRAGPVRGIARLRQALPLIDGRAESIPESRIRVAFDAAGLPAPEVNPTIRDRGRFVARVDLLFAAYGVIVEYEGAQHATDLRQWRRDLDRIGRLQELGFVVIRAHAGDLRDPTALIARVRTHLVRRGWRP